MKFVTVDGISVGFQAEFIKELDAYENKSGFLITRVVIGTEEDNKLVPVNFVLAILDHYKDDIIRDMAEYMKVDLSTVHFAGVCPETYGKAEQERAIH